MQKQKPKLKLSNRADAVLAAVINFLLFGYISIHVGFQAYAGRNNPWNSIMILSFLFMYLNSVSALISSVLVLVEKKFHVAIRLQKMSSRAVLILIPILTVNYIIQGFDMPIMRLEILTGLCLISIWMSMCVKKYEKSSSRQS